VKGKVGAERKSELKNTTEKKCWVERFSRAGCEFIKVQLTGKGRPGQIGLFELRISVELDKKNENPGEADKSTHTLERRRMGSTSVLLSLSVMLSFLRNHKKKNPATCQRR